jgi:hypothetical protein
MDDGGVGSGGTLNLNTDNYTENEVELLMDALTQNFNLKCRKSLKRLNQWLIVIPKSQVNKVAEITYKHMHPSMYYKIGK